MEYWNEKSLEYKYQMTQVFEQQLEDIQEIVPDFYIANATIHFEEHSPHMHIVGVPVKENCKKKVYQGKLVKLLYLQKNH